MRHIRWKRIAFWVALWWFVYTAPTEDPFARFRDALDEQAIGDWPATAFVEGGQPVQRPR